MSKTTKTASAAEELAKALIVAVGKSAESMEIEAYLDTGYPPLNERLSGSPDGGLPYARIVEIFGDSGTGKTAFAMDMIKAAQHAGGVGCYHDHERGLNPDLARRNGVNTDAPWFTYKRPETFEDSCATALRVCTTIRESKFIPDSAPIVYVFDSVAAMIPHSVLYDSKTGKRRTMDSQTMNDTSALSRVASNSVKILNQEMARLNVICIFLNQIRTKIGVVYGDPTTTPGGSAWKFYATTRLELSRKLVKEGENKEVVAQIVNFHTKKNRMEKPFQDIELLLAFSKEKGAEWDRVTSIISELLTANKLTLVLKGNKQKYITWEAVDYAYKAFITKVRDENLYDKLVALYKAEPIPAAVVNKSAADAAATALADL